MAGLSARIDATICCRECHRITVFCPICGLCHFWMREAEAPETFPELLPESLCDCGATIQVQVTGYDANPTGERPAPEVLSDSLLERLELAWNQPAAVRHPHGAKHEQRQLQRPEYIPISTPCGPLVPRYRLSHWQAHGVVPEGLPPATIARGYRLAFDRPPQREPGRTTRLYSERELALALRALGYPVHRWLETLQQNGW